jgi:AraC-like DNA-binding protein
MCRSLIGREFSPLRIELRRPEPARLADFNALLRSPLQFGASRNCMVFTAESIERRLDAGNPELAQHNDAIALRYLSNTEIRGIAVRVREVLTATLADGEPSEEDVAQLLNLSVRTLQRKLIDSGTTYREVLDDTRQDLALSYLRVSLYSITTITYMLGYSATSSFTRAFRRWTGQSPTEWRAQASSKTSMTRSQRT